MEYAQLLKDVRLVRTVPRATLRFSAGALLSSPLHLSTLAKPVLLMQRAQAAQAERGAPVQGEVSKLHFVDTAKTYHRNHLENPERWRPPGGDALVLYKDGHVGYVSSARRSSHALVLQACCTPHSSAPQGCTANQCWH